MACAVLTDERIDTLIQAVERLETYNDTAQLLPLLVK
jgi:hypothetical protein